MTMQRRLISLVGTLVVIVALVASTLLVALPVYLESRDIKHEEARVAASNQILVAQIDGLRAQRAEMPRIEADLAGLRAELPHIPQLDDVVKLALRAADAVDGTVQGVEFDAPAGFTPRTAEDVLSSLPSSAVGVPTGADPAQPADDADPAEPTAADAGGTPQREPTSAAERLQVPVTITVTAATTTDAARFLDELREGPRLLQIDTTTGVLDPETDVVSLTVNGLVFVQVK